MSGKQYRERPAVDNQEITGLISGYGKVFRKRPKTLLTRESLNFKIVLKLIQIISLVFRRARIRYC
jgi:hypothetical protein